MACHGGAGHNTKCPAIPLNCLTPSNVPPIANIKRTSYHFAFVPNRGRPRIATTRMPRAAFALPRLSDPAFCGVTNRPEFRPSHQALGPIRYGQIILHRSAACGPHVTTPLARETPPACPAYRGVSCGSVQVAIFDGQTVLPLPRTRRRNRKTVRAPRTPRHRHHPPGIRNFHSDSYAEIDMDSLRTGLSSVVREFGSQHDRPYRLADIRTGGRLGVKRRASTEAATPGSKKR